MTVPASATVRARPRDRRRRIEEAAAEAFAARGYHRVSMKEVASAVGISAPALYRHFPTKYALFVHTVLAVPHRLLDDTTAPSARPLNGRDDAVRALDALLDAVIATTIDSRAAGGLYRWEGRYLHVDDRARLGVEFRALRERFARAHAVYRPGLGEAERDLLVRAALGAVASITTHRTVVAAATLADILRGAAWRVLDVTPASPTSRREPEPSGSLSRRDRLIAEAVRLFAERGYHDVPIEEIAAGAGLTASGVYRHFERKPDILLAAYERAAARLEEGAARARAGAAADPATRLRVLADDFVRCASEDEPLVRVYFAEVDALGDEGRIRLRALQRAYLAEWIGMLMDVRPELTRREAAVLVHAGCEIVSDLGAIARHRHVDLSDATAGLLGAVLGGDA